jgi:hypothetical protein
MCAARIALLAMSSAAILPKTHTGVPLLVILGDADKIHAVANCQKMRLD